MIHDRLLCPINGAAVVARPLDRGGEFGACWLLSWILTLLSLHTGARRRKSIRVAPLHTIVLGKTCCGGQYRSSGTVGLSYHIAASHLFCFQFRTSRAFALAAGVLHRDGSWGRKPSAVLLAGRSRGSGRCSGETRADSTPLSARVEPCRITIDAAILAAQTARCTVAKHRSRPGRAQGSYTAKHPFHSAVDKP